VYQPYVSAGLNAGLSAIALLLTFALCLSALAGGALLHRVEHRRVLWLGIGAVGFAAAVALTQAATLSSFYGQALRFRGPVWPLLLAGACLLVLGAVCLTAVLSERLRVLALSLSALSATFCVSVSGAMMLYAVNGDRAPALRSPLLLSGALALGVVAATLSLRIVHQLREQRGFWLTPSRRLLPACVIGAAIIDLQYVALGALALRGPQFNAHITARGELVLLVGAVMLLAVAAALAQSYVDRAQADRLADLTRVAYVLQALSADPHPLQRLVDAAVELGGAHRAGVLVEDGAGSLKLLALSAGAEEPGDWEAIRVPLKDVGAFIGGRRAFIPDFQAAECSTALREYVGPRAVLCEPIRAGGKVAGMLAVVCQTRRHRPSPELAGLSELLAASGGWTIERGEMLERLHDNNARETRTRVASDLHDFVIQDIAVALTYTSLARSTFGLASSAPTTERLSELAGFLDEFETHLHRTQRDMSGLVRALRSGAGDTQSGVLL
jgi:GAF domain-containing protein